MQKTKEKILETALRLFNEHGIDAITVRHIAKELGISHGNLCYHFANNSVIIEQLYLKLLQELDLVLSEISVQALNLQEIYKSVEAIFKKFYKYRFLMQDFIGVIRKVPVLKQRHRDLVAVRYTFFRFMVEEMKKQGIIREQRIEGEFEMFFQQLFIISDFWMAEAEILFDGTEQEKIKHYTQTTFGLLVPYLTEKGMEEYRKIKNSHS